VSELGDFVRAARRRSGLSVEQFGLRINRGQKWIYRLETGGRCQPDLSDLEAITVACGLTAWERRYLYLLAGRPSTWQPGEPDIAEYLERVPEPRAWISASGNYFNSEFRRLFPGCEGMRDMVHWHFEHPMAKVVIVNWSEIADWWVATGRLRCASEPDNAALADSLAKNLTNDAFRELWQAQTIPHDPAPRIWVVRDGRHEVNVEVQIWRHAYLSGALLAGFTRE